MKFRRRVLILEDDPGTQLLIKKMLLKIDPYLGVVTATTAESAYFFLNEAIWDGFKFDLVVADVNLPGSTGILLWEVVNKRFHVDFLFISGMPEEKWTEQTKRFREVPPFLPKPLTEESLREFWLK